MKVKKIAFIGCSHLSTHDQPSQQKNNWTYQLYQKYPHYQYRSYSKGGQGIEHFQWHLLDAKKWGADIVFMNRTYLGRWAMLTQADGKPYGEFDYISNDIFAEDNWSEMLPMYECYWGTINDHIRYTRAADIPGEQFRYDDTDARTTCDKLNTAQPYWKLYSGSETRLKWELEWYSNVEKLYNFDNLFLLDWNAASHQVPKEYANKHNYRIGPHPYTDDKNIKHYSVYTSTTWDMPVEDWFYKKYNLDIHKGQALWKVGIQTSETDNHLSPKGNTQLLNEYILANKKVLDSLE
jgi:hypothetical protein